jgi:hypothetical protein
MSPVESGQPDNIVAKGKSRESAGIYMGTAMLEWTFECKPVTAIATGSKPPAFLFWVNNCFGCYCVFEIIYYAVYSVRAAEVDFGRILQQA